MPRLTKEQRAAAERARDDEQTLNRLIRLASTGPYAQDQLALAGGLLLLLRRLEEVRS